MRHAYMSVRVRVRVRVCACARVRVRVCARAGRRVALEATRPHNSPIEPGTYSEREGACG